MQRLCNISSGQLTLFFPRNSSLLWTCRFSDSEVSVMVLAHLRPMLKPILPLRTQGMCGEVINESLNVNYWRSIGINFSPLTQTKCYWKTKKEFVQLVSQLLEFNGTFSYLIYINYYVTNKSCKSPRIITVFIMH